MDAKRLDLIQVTLRNLIDDVTLTPDKSDHILERIEQLRGVVWYALEVGDIEKHHYRILMDQLNDLYEAAITLKPLT